MRSRFIIFVAPLWLLAAQAAKATDEIQVYNAAIAEVGQFTIQQHLNYIPLGLKDPPFPGGLVSNHSLNGTPEFAYGMTDWWEVGLYLPFSIQDQKFYSDGFKLRTLFVSPHADRREFFYGVNFEFSNETPPLRKPASPWKYDPSLASASRTTSSSSIRSWTSALANTERRILRLLLASREKSARICGRA